MSGNLFNATAPEEWQQMAIWIRFMSHLLNEAGKSKAQNHPPGSLASVLCSEAVNYAG